jgi:hypothetical protein
MRTPQKIVFADAMSPQRFAQEATLRAQEVILNAALTRNPPAEITEEYAEEIAKEATRLGHATAEAYGTPRLPD